MFLDTLYGKLEVTDPLAIELINSAPFQRLKGINQYGVVNYILPTEAYNRFDHSIGVYFLLKNSKLSRHEQIAGLLHDVSHTVFSHVGDYVFQKTHCNHSYQDSIHLWYLSESGLSAILEKHGIAADLIHHENEDFQALEKPLPYLSADRIDYNLQGGLRRGLLSKEEFLSIYQGLSFDGKNWVLNSQENGRKLADCSLIMTETLWGAPWEALSYRLTADALIHSFSLKLITKDEFHFSTDDVIWDKLISAKDPYIQERMKKIQNIHSLYSLTEHGEEDQLLKVKFFGINPLVSTPQGIFPLTTLDAHYKLEFERVKNHMERGWAIKFTGSQNTDF